VADTAPGPEDHNRSQQRQDDQGQNQTTRLSDRVRLAPDGAHGADRRGADQQRDEQNPVAGPAD